MNTTFAFGRLAALTVTLLFAVAACGGGGGSGGEGGNKNPAPGPGPSPTSLTISLGDDRLVDEGSDGGTTLVEFRVFLDAPATVATNIDYATAHITTEDPDFIASSGIATIAAGDTETTIAIEVVADTAFELHEQFRVELANPPTGVVIGDGEALGKLINDDPLTVIMDLIYLGLGDGVLVGPTVEIDYDMLIDLQDWLDDLGLIELLVPYDIYYRSDIHIPFIVASGSLRLVSGSGTGGTVRLVLPPGFDAFAIGGEFQVVFDWSAFFENLIEATWEFIAAVEPQDVDPSTPILGVTDEVVFNEGAAGESIDLIFLASLSESLASDVVLDYDTVDATATSPADYTATSGSITIPAGQTSATFTVTVHGDDEPEGVGPEMFFVSLIADTEAAVLRSPFATGFIYDDDTPVEQRRISIGNAEMPEGDAGTANMQFQATLDAPAVAPVTFRWGTRDDTAQAGSDYESTSGESTFAPGESSLTINVPVHGDTDPEDDEWFLLEVTATFGNATALQHGRGTIRTDDPIARVSINDVGYAEGHAGMTPFAFTVSLSEALGEALDIAFISGDVTANFGDDYVAISSTLTIPAGDTQGTIEVFVHGDTEPEDDEVFELTIDVNSPAALLTKSVGLATILNDDGAGGWQGEELVHDPDPGGPFGAAVWPQVGFGPGGERHVSYVQSGTVRHRVSPARTVWNAETVIAPITSTRAPRLAVDNAGRALAAWPDSAAVTTYSYDPAGGWQPQPLPMLIDIHTNLNLALDAASGEAIVVWSEPPNASNNNVRSTFGAHYVPGAGWPSFGLIETADGEVLPPEIALAPNGTAISVFPQPPAGSAVTDIVAYQLVAGSWIGPEVLDSVVGEYASSPKIDINASGNAAVVWFQAEPVVTGIARSSIYMTRYDSTSGLWSGAELVEHELDFSMRDPDVAVDADGNVFVIWLQQSPDYRRENLHVNRYDVATGTWSGPRLLELDDTADVMPIISQQVVADDLGNAIVCWIQDDGVLHNLRSARYSADDGDWQTTELLEVVDTGDAALPHLVIDRASGDAMVVWAQDEGAKTNIYGNRYVN